MPKDVPDYQDADVVLRLYEMRREEVMRQSRHSINREFWPKSYEEVVAITKYEHPLNTAFRQVGTYWEMVYGLAKHGIVHADYFMESNGEGLLLFAKIHPHLERYRKEISPVAFRHAEWVSRECAEGRRIFAAFQERVRKALEKDKKQPPGRP